MLIIPAIDLKGGRCVRLRQGKASRVEIFSTEPVKVAKIWEDRGAKLLHLVDLDGAFKGKLQNFSLIKAIVKSVKIPVQLGGGLRDSREISRVFKAGVKRVILGTRAFESPDWVKTLTRKYGRRILIAIDNADGKLAVRGWRKKIEINIVDFISEMKKSGISSFIFTDVKRDGMMTGPNIEAIKEVLSKVRIKLIASGGISRREDLRQLKKLEKKGLIGVIIGRALYTGAIKLKEAIKIGAG
ncbi:MAG: 1-(5-phosphoribosyl)-5-[(5-phosphoribosylamino)methylideneamino]imidazole-4-carboxamide isomerase [Candidatus Ratteibacteria bacterium]|nr:1-(5-phosphoribosyl)-5-[(5-phosphoribosylamino)methylideneamino]imidazole-4-carboxamide isomerase [Candidatus Ratteibacteria bacterium]